MHAADVAIRQHHRHVRPALRDVGRQALQLGRRLVRAQPRRVAKDHDVRRSRRQPTDQGRHRHAQAHELLAFLDEVGRRQAEGVKDGDLVTIRAQLGRGLPQPEAGKRRIVDVRRVQEKRRLDQQDLGQGSLGIQSCHAGMDLQIRPARQRQYPLRRATRQAALGNCLRPLGFFAQTCALNVRPLGCCGGT